MSAYAKAKPLSLQYNKIKNKRSNMNQVMTDIWPYLVAPVIAAIAWLFREVFLLKTQATVFEKAINSMQSRLDSHSKKQDDILDKMSSMEKEVLKQMGTVRSDIAGLASDVKGFSNLILVSDQGIKIPRQ